MSTAGTVGARPDDPTNHRRAWRPGTTFTPDERRQVLAALYPTRADARHWWFRFGAMLALSVVVATLGLSENSSAVVIGAMLIAPLMTPIIGVSAALVMVWPRRLAHSTLALVVGTAGALLVSWALAMLLPTSDQLVTSEVLARTSPNLGDLLVALAAGAAGAYATVRSDISGALPGVAVAVALVPPLATAGFTLAIGRSDLAGGALLLFAANVTAIVLAGALVLLACGFVPARRRELAQQGIRLGLVAVIIATAAVTVPLTVATLRNASRSQQREAINQAVVNWLASEPSLKVDGVTIAGADLTVEVAGPQAPPSSTPLLRALVGMLGPSTAVRVRWFQTSQAGVPAGSSKPGITLAEVRPLVEAWLAKANASAVRIVRISIGGDAVSVELAGQAATAPAQVLAQAISQHAGRTVTVAVSWTLSPAAAGAQHGVAPGSGEGVATTARSVVDSWLASHPGVQLVALSATGSSVTVIVAATSPSLVTSDLHAALVSELGPADTVAVDFIRERALAS